MSLALGIPIDEMLTRIPAETLAEYMAYDRIEPIGEVRADLRAGIIASTVANHSMSPPKEPMRPLDFMPFARKQSGPILIKNQEDHSRLLAKTIFGDKVK